jgi:hypothetical protein
VYNRRLDGCAVFLNQEDQLCNRPHPRIEFVYLNSLVRRGSEGAQLELKPPFEWIASLEIIRGRARLANQIIESVVQLRTRHCAGLLGIVIN